MRSMWAIAKRDVRSFFVSPLAWVVLTIWMLVCGGQFYIMCGWFAQNPSSGGSDNPVAFFYGGTVLFFLALLVFVPILTMRLLAEERQSGIDEAMLTTPVTPLAMVMGKYLAAMTYWAAMWIPTLMYVWICKNFGYEDWGATGAIFVGVFGIGLHYMAIGLLASAIASTQLVAAVLAFFILSTFFVLGIASSVLPDWGEVLNYISVMEHMRVYSRGIVDSRYLAFDVLTAALALFLSVRVVDARRYQ